MTDPPIPPGSPPVPPGPGGPDKGLRAKIKPKYVGAAVVVVLLVIFMLENLRRVPIRFIGPQAHAPLFLALLVSAALGALLVLVVQRLRKRG
ncbi:MAG TPA: hypothetical protein VH373_23240 [Jatrophihabitantaceae bacterium]|jgi:uncharacterized integral membrane protein